MHSSRLRQVWAIVSIGVIALLVTGHVARSGDDGETPDLARASATPTITATSTATVPLAASTATTTPSPAASPSPAPTETPAPSPTATDVPPTATPTEASPVAEPAATDIADANPRWAEAPRTPDGAAMGVVTAPELNVRAGPAASAGLLGTVWQGHTVTVYELVTSPEDGSAWYRVGDGRYVAATYVDPFIPAPPEQTFEGHWVDVDLSTFYAVAYDGTTPVYAALITAGREDRTPRGVFRVFYRVRSETMDSATVGIPKNDPEYYYLENVEYTQYFKDGGFAIHGNYWTAPEDFGGYTSNGCVGLLNVDAAWFWQFLDEGSAVSIHD